MNVNPFDDALEQIRQSATIPKLICDSAMLNKLRTQGISEEHLKTIVVNYNDLTNGK